MDGFHEYLHELGSVEHIVLTGHLLDEESVWMNCNCCVNLYPTYFEGIDVPVSKGMRLGAQALTSDSTLKVAMVRVRKGRLLHVPQDLETETPPIACVAVGMKEIKSLNVTASTKSLPFVGKHNAVALLGLEGDALRSLKGIVPA